MNHVCMEHTGIRAELRGVNDRLDTLRCEDDTLHGRMDEHLKEHRTQSFMIFCTLLGTVISAAASIAAIIFN